MKERNGDLIRMFSGGEFDLIVHGCNCFHTMGAGIAGTIAKQFPYAAKVDRECTAYGDITKLSNSSIAHVGEGRNIVNMYTQYLPGKDLYMNALVLGFQKLSKQIHTTERIGIPAIGCGIAGGDWEELAPIIADIMRGHNITYVEYVPVKETFPNATGDLIIGDFNEEH